jgi:pimeloyl-ACP methyl ester carboxylesterase
LRNDGQFFPGGWGDPEILALSLVQLAQPPVPEFRCLSEVKNPSHLVREYRFASPHPERNLPKESEFARCLMVLPRPWDHTTGICVHLAATGDEGYADRHKLLALPLLEHGIGSVILENPFYGVRRPANQKGTYVDTVSGLWLMGMSAVAEARVILGWLASQGFHRLGVSGISMGGQMSSHVAALYPEPLAVCACIAPHCATPVFLEGVLSKYTDWKALDQDEAEARRRLKEQLDRSDLRLFPKPPRTDCCIWVAASYDAYVNAESCRLTQATWPASTIRWLASGHVSSVLFRRKAFLKGIRDAFALLDLPPLEAGGWLP